MDLPPDAYPRTATVKRLRLPRWLLAAGGALLLAAFIYLFPWPHTVYPRVIILGLDGLEPKLLEQYVHEGRLPHFAQMIAAGQFHRLRTTNPAQSPVSWSTFTSGSNPGKHGIFDFICRDPRTYMPGLSLIREEVGGPSIEVGGNELSLTATRFKTVRSGLEFWDLLEQENIPTRIIHVPVTFPPSGSRRMLAGMGVPDIRGTQGTFSFYTEEPVTSKDVGGQVLRVAFSGPRAEAEIIGPADAGTNTPLTLPLQLERPLEFSGPDAAIEITTSDTVFTLREGAWSGWVRFEFSLNFYTSVSAIGRFYLSSAQPLGLYLSPLQFDPDDPVAPISIPAEYASQIAEAIGPYHTLGMPEETWALNEGRINEDAFLAQVGTLYAEQRAVLEDELATLDSGLLVWVTMTSDRIQHMFWRTIDPEHPLYTPEIAERYGDVIAKMYAEMDTLVGYVQQQLRPEDTLIVMSDHGFSSFRRSVHVNSWLRDQGLLKLYPGSDTSPEFFQQVDWSRTQAYAVGLGSIYLNRAGREGRGVVASDEEANALTSLIITMLSQWKDNGAPVVAAAYPSSQIYHGPLADEAPDIVVGYNPGYRASWQTALGAVPADLCEDNNKKWSGDHCIEPSLVPGVFFCNHPLQRDTPGIEDIAPSVLKHYGLPVPEEMDGSPLW